MGTTLVSPNKLTHLHVSTTARDCDGLYEDDYVLVPANQTARELFAHLAVRATQRSWDHNIRLTREVTSDGLPTFEYSASTDEGWRHEQVYACDDDCDTGERRFRDHTAEAEGY